MSERDQEVGDHGMPGQALGVPPQAPSATNLDAIRGRLRSAYVGLQLNGFLERSRAEALAADVDYLLDRVASLLTALDGYDTVGALERMLDAEDDAEVVASGIELGAPSE